MNDAPTNVPNETTEVKFPRQAIDITGQRFGRLAVIRFAGRGGYKNRVSWLCKCDCGASVTAQGIVLRFGVKKSCGCLQIDTRRATPLLHGHMRGKKPTAEYRAWRGMKQRCFHVKSRSYKHYGGRGITVCERWLESFESFLADMGFRPSPEHSLGRVNNDGNYEKSNCRWETRIEQHNNTRVNVLLSHLGKSLTVAEWSRVVGVNSDTLLWRIRHGWTHEKALMTPMRKNKRRTAFTALR